MGVACTRNSSTWGNQMSKNKRWLSVIAAVLVSSAPAFAAEVPAAFDAKTCKAEYPKASLMNEEQGTVSMSFLVKADGSVADSKVDKSSGFKNLDKAAIKALSACKFKPGTKDGAPAETWTKVDYAWKLD